MSAPVSETPDDAGATVVRRAARSGVWFAAIKGIAQVLSWAVTIVVARLLSPGDYGLMSIATVATGYVEVFSELGLGAAIVQRPNVTQLEYSSNFWLSLMVGTAFGIVAFGLAYPTAWVFGEPRVIPLTQSVSLLFLVGSLMTVPYNMMVRELRFKEIGIAQLLSVVASTAAMLGFALNGFGVWTLLIGTFVSRTTMVVAVFAFTRWRPSWQFGWKDVRGFLRFGINVAGGRSLFFVFQKADIFLVGTLLGTQAVGLYSFTLNLASMPTDKIAGLINQTAFPLFAKFQTDIARLQDLFLRMNKVIAIGIAPLFVAGAWWGDLIVPALLGDKWVAIIPLFRAMCLVQLVSAMTILNGPLHTALGEARRIWVFYGACIPLMSGGIYLAAPYGLNAVMIPWLLIYPLLCAGWTVATLRLLSLRPKALLEAVGRPVVASCGVAVLASTIATALILALRLQPTPLSLMLLQLTLAAPVFAWYLWRIESATLATVWNLRRP